VFTVPTQLAADALSAGSISSSNASRMAASGALDAGLRIGDRLRVRGPMGQFTLRLSHRPMVMVAVGSGMAQAASRSPNVSARDIK
jgi:ferredoxin-NADP reductase